MHGLSGYRGSVGPTSYSRYFSAENVNIFLATDGKSRKEPREHFGKINYLQGTHVRTCRLTPQPRFNETTGSCCLQKISVDYARTKRWSLHENSQESQSKILSSSATIKSQLESDLCLINRQERQKTERRRAKHQPAKLNYQDIDEDEEMQRWSNIKLWMAFFG